MNSSVVNLVADEILFECLEDFLLEDSLELTWCIRTNNINIDELYNLIPLDSLMKEERIIAKPNTTTSYSVTIFCPICNEQVAGTRFAPHLEKCMNGGKRGSRKYNDALFDDSLYRMPTKPRAVEIPDPYPSSLVVKIRLKQGVPYGNTRRIGASVEDFNCGKIEHGKAVVAATTSQNVDIVINRGVLNGSEENQNDCMSVSES